MDASNCVDSYVCATVHDIHSALFLFQNVNAGRKNKARLGADKGMSSLLTTPYQHQQPFQLLGRACLSSFLPLPRIENIALRDLPQKFVSMKIIASMETDPYS